MTKLSCACCGWTYTQGTGEWWQHVCSGRGKGAAHKWQEAWCHLDRAGAEPRDGACGQCAAHCRCSTRQKNNFPQMQPEESIEQFIHRLESHRRGEWSPHNS